LKVSVQREDFDLSRECEFLRDGKREVGALATFVGVVREVPMTLEHYPGMTQKSIEKIAREAMGRWKLIDCTVIHRYGDLRPGDRIVMVAVAGAHRADAFAACEFIMDYLKTQAPFWKKEHTPEGARWVDARVADDAALERWGIQAGNAGKAA